MTEEQPQKPVRRKNKGASTGGAFLTLSGAEGFSQIAVLLRGAIIFRVIGAEQLGLAATMVVFGELLNRMVNLNPGITLVQDRWGGSRGFRHTLQSVILIRTLLYSIVLFALAIPLASFFGQEQHTAGFMAVALLPLLGGFVHVDIYRQLRNRNYMPVAMVTSIPNIVSLCTTVLFSFWLQTFWLPLTARGISNLTGVLVSMRMAKRKLGFALERKHLIRILKFLIPLAGAGIIVWLSTSGQQTLIASAPQMFDGVQFTMVDVGFWVLAMQLANIPSQVGSRVISQTWSPRLARMRDDPNQFRKIFVEMQTLSYTLGAAVIIGLGAGTIWAEIYGGEAGAAAGPILSILSILGGLKLGRVAMRSAALATGRSNIVFYANCAGLIGLGTAVLAILNNSSLETIAYCMIIGELASLLVGNLMLTRGKLALSVRDLWLRPILLCGAGILIAIFERELLQQVSLYVGAIISFLLAAGMIGAMAMFNKNIRSFIASVGGGGKS